jgi:NAD(P)H dehydrogenase (quinone)
VEAGEFEHQSGDLERLLGTKTKTFKEYIELTPDSTTVSIKN